MTTTTDSDQQQQLAAVLKRHPHLYAYAPAVFHGRPNREQRAAVLEFNQHVWLCTFGIDELRPEGEDRLTPEECKVLVLAALATAERSQKGAWAARALIAVRDIRNDEHPLSWAVMQLAIINMGWEL